MTHESSVLPLRARPRHRTVLAACILYVACGESAPRASDDTAAGPSDTAARPVAAQAAGAADTVAQPRAGDPLGLVLDTATIWLDSTTVHDAEASLGAAAASRTRREGEHVHVEKQACYRVGTGSEQVTARLVAEDEEESDPASMTIYRIVLDRAAPTSPANASCRALAAPPPRWTNGLRLGMTRAQVERGLGPPKRVEEGHALYEYEDRAFRRPYRDARTGQPGVSITYESLTLKIRYEQDTVVRIDAWRTSEPNESAR